MGWRKGNITKDLAEIRRTILQFCGNNFESQVELAERTWVIFKEITQTNLRKNRKPEQIVTIEEI